MPDSTRISIVRQALDDILERLAELDTTAKVRELRMKAASFDRAVRGWDTKQPTEQERASMLKNVLELNMAVIAAGKETQGG